jgi:uncharacterized membrane protein HdeD (DUF308 family)
MRTLNALVSRYWWTIVLRGLVALFFGVVSFAWPGATVAGLVLLFGAYSLVDGIAGVILGIKNYGEQERWWATLIGGIVSLGAGLVALVMPGLTALTLLTLIGIWAIARGVSDIMAAIRLRHVITGEWLLALGGALSIVFGLFVVAFPGTGALALAWWIGAYALILGVVLIALGFRLRSRAYGVEA